MMQASKVITKSGGITFPRGMRQETGILPGVPVDIRTDEDGVHISKHVPACFHCGTVEDVKEVLGLEICPACAAKILEGME
jgi:transcriptional pleiotropic regulator of transition state genes